MLRSFLPIQPDEVRNLRPETTPPRPKRIIGRAIFSVVVLVALLGVLKLLSLASPSPLCSEQEAAAWVQVDHFVPLEPGDGQLPGCAALVETHARASAVLDHYAATLRAQGWTITDRQDPVPGAAIPSAPPPGGPEPIPDSVVELGGSIEAARDGLTFSVAYDAGWAMRGGATTYELVATLYVLISEA